MHAEFRMQKARGETRLVHEKLIPFGPLTSVRPSNCPALVSIQNPQTFVHQPEFPDITLVRICVGDTQMQAVFQAAFDLATADSGRN